ncbi:hypothetical protein [Deinococcus sp. 6GRE01]|uniref:hypothetical protein n=1 Tax=Deinococcus sp. 6GRE01 TaxID=2745873 RepID=UPI001E3D811A|nr:hypothetical protein [Deinococcus sp. 6GRE01]MCD0155845.1 hypothetical protein [Deinococcus sp. 6GRE01]
MSLPTPLSTPQEREQTLSERLFSYADRLGILAGTWPVEVPHYVKVEDYFGQEFENDGWLCEAHAEAFTAKYGGEIEYNPYSPSEDTIGHCDVCGAALRTSLTDEGIEYELEHWETCQLRAHPGEHWELQQTVFAVTSSNDESLKVRTLALLDGFHADGAL